MRILLIHDLFPIASETFIVDQVFGLVGRGHDVAIVGDWSEEHAARIGDPNLKEKLRARMIDCPAVPRNRVARVLDVAGRLVVYPSSWRWLFPSLDARGIGREVLSLRPFYCALRLAALRTPFDLVLCHFGPNGVKAERLLRNRRPPLVTFLHGADVSSVVQERGRTYYRRLFAHGDRFVAVSEWQRRRLIDLGCSEDRVVVHPTGVDLDRFRWVPAGIDPSKDVVRVASVGRFVEKKGLEYLIRAAAAWRRESPRLEVRIAGDGPLRRTLENQVDELGVRHRVTMLGWQTRSQIQALMEASDVIVQPSVTASNGDEEGLPVVLKEAMASGRPVVTTRHGGIPEIIEHGETGLLVAERAPDEIVAAIGRIVDEPALGGRLSRNARLMAERRFDQRILDDRLEVLLGDVVAAAIIDGPRKR